MSCSERKAHSEFALVYARKAEIDRLWAAVAFTHNEEYIDGSFHRPDKHGLKAGKGRPFVMQEGDALTGAKGVYCLKQRGFH